MMGWLSSLFLSPLGALFALSIPAVVALYFLKLKRKREVVPSILLWRRSLQEFTANAPFQRLKANPLLLLQILLLALLTLAMTRPVLEGGSLIGVDLFVVVDRSASMGAVDVEPNRLESAKQGIRDLIRSMGAGDRMMIVAVSNRSEVLVPLVADRGELLAAVDRLHVEDVGADFEEAASILKAAIGEKAESSRILIYSDGGPARNPDVSFPSAETRFIQVGESSANVGITRLSVNAAPNDSNRMDVFVEIAAHSSAPGDCTVSLLLDDQLLDARTIAWSTSGERVEVFQIPLIEEGLLTVEVDEGGMLNSDDRASVRIETRKPIRVRLFSPGDTPTARALSSIPGVSLEVADPSALSATAAADVLVLESVPLPDVPPGLQGIFILGPPLPAAFPSASTEEVEHPIVLDWNRSHPVVRGAEFGNLRISRAAWAVVPPEGETLIESRDGPLLFTGEIRGVRSIAATFSVHDSNWPRLYSFPITLTNAIRWLAGREDRMSLATARRTGDSIPLPEVHEESDIEIMGPGGFETRLPATPGETAYFGGAVRAGEYRFDIGEDRSLAESFNLLDPLESKIAPSERLVLGRTEIAVESQPRPIRREIWSWFAAAGLLALIGEWLLYTRRAWM